MAEENRSAGAVASHLLNRYPLDTNVAARRVPEANPAEVAEPEPEPVVPRPEAQRNPRVVALARKYGMTNEEIQTYTDDEILAAVNTVAAPAVQPSQNGRHNPEPEAPRGFQFDFGRDEAGQPMTREHYAPHIVGLFDQLGTALVEAQARIERLERSLGESRARTENETIHSFLSKYPEKFGGDQPTQAELRRRKAFLAAAKPFFQGDVGAALSAAYQAMYGDEPNPAAAPADPNRPTQEQWTKAGTLPASSRGATELPPGRERARINLEKRLNEGQPQKVDYTGHFLPAGGKR